MPGWSPQERHRALPVRARFDDFQAPVREERGDSRAVLEEDPRIVLERAGVRELSQALGDPGPSGGGFHEGVGRIEEQPVEAARDESFERERLLDVAANEERLLAHADRVEIGANDLQGAGAAIHEDDLGGPSRQGLEPERARPAAQIEADGPLDVSEHVEDRLPETRGGGPYVEPRQRAQSPPAETSTRDSEHVLHCPPISCRIGPSGPVFEGPFESGDSSGRAGHLTTTSSRAIAIFMVLLGVNVDHVATVRQARRGREPDPVAAAVLAELGGADQITVHLREDRRHIQDRDVYVLRETVASRLNLEMAVVDEIVEIALDVRPEQVTLVPERREEITTEGGLDVIGCEDSVRAATESLAAAGIRVALFVDPDAAQIQASARAGAHAVEIHTGTFAEAWTEGGADAELTAIRDAATVAKELGLHVAAGHGLDYRNVVPVVAIETLAELNIGHSIVSRALSVGMTRAVAEMKYLLNRSRPLAAAGSAP